MNNRDTQLIYEAYAEDSDFNSKWKKAVASSDELSTGVDLMKNLKKAQPNGEVYIVGGVARDILMGGEIDDVDLATNMNIEELEASGFKVANISKDDSQPVYALKWGDWVYDFALFRVDSKDTDRKSNIPTVTDSFEADTSRRDLTINSFGIDENGKVHDFQGGIDDIKNKIIRAVGDPRERFKEDATRILRTFRFAAKTGFELDEETRQAAIELKDSLNDNNAISQESIAKEFYKSAKSGPTLAAFVEKLLDAGILENVLPEFTAMDGLTHDPEHHPEGGSTVIGHILETLKASPYTDPVQNLAILFHDLGKAVTRGDKPNGQSSYHGHEGAGVPIVKDIFNRLKFNELGAQDKKHILFAVARHMLVHNLDQLSPKKLREIVLDDGWEVLKAVGFADEASRGVPLFDEEEFHAKIERAESKVKGSLGGTRQEANAKVKQYIDGGKLMKWFPFLKTNATYIGKVLPVVQDYIVNQLSDGQENIHDDVIVDVAHNALRDALEKNGEDADAVMMTQ
jgi:tRNA nucleotidyltransferase/poly(A) polymerase